MSSNHFYLVCKRSLLGNLSPVKIFTALVTAESFCSNNKKYVILKQSNSGELVPITDNK
nr:MAG TPA: hypothetical protein [Caudoviricetes sp.]